MSGDLCRTPGLVVMECAGKQTVRTASHPGGLWSVEVQEDIRSFVESMPWFIRVDERGKPIRCECCGTLVALTPEARDRHGPFAPGIWEHETLRKHTLRRCEWRRANP
jgi:hypothetical protein